MSCISLFPISKPCGYHGECTNVTSSESNSSFVEVCLCKTGWRQTQELNFAVNDETISSSMCSVHEDTLYYSYLVGTAVAAAALLLQLFYIRKWKMICCNSKSINLGYLMITMLLVAVPTLAYRFLNLNTVLLGQDAAFSFGVGLMIGISFCLAQVVLSKYIGTLDAQIFFQGDYAVRKKKFFNSSMKPLIATDILFNQLFFVSCFLEDQKISEILFLSVLGYASFRSVYFLFFTRELLGAHLRHMRTLMRSSSSRKRGHYTNNDGVQIMGRTPKFKAWLLKSYPRTKKNYRLIQFMAVIMLLYSVLPLILEYFSILWVYGTPLISTVYFILITLSTYSTMSKLDTTQIKHISYDSEESIQTEKRQSSYPVVPFGGPRQHSKPHERGPYEMDFLAAENGTANPRYNTSGAFGFLTSMGSRKSLQEKRNSSHASLGSAGKGVSRRYTLRLSASSSPSPPGAHRNSSIPDIPEMKLSLTGSLRNSSISKRLSLTGIDNTQRSGPLPSVPSLENDQRQSSHTGSVGNNHRQSSHTGSRTFSRTFTMINPQNLAALANVEDNDASNNGRVVEDDEESLV